MVTLEFEDIQKHLPALIIGPLLLIAGPLLILDEEITSTAPGTEIFFLMNAILALFLVVAGILLIIVGIHGIRDDYKREK
jgi:hypothetical protein